MKRPRVVYLSFLFICFFSFSQNVIGEIFKIGLNEPMPKSFYRICSDENAARQMRAKADQCAKSFGSCSEVPQNFSINGCIALTTTIVPIKELPDLAGSFGLNQVYSPNKPSQFCKASIDIDGKDISIPCQWTNQQSTKYFEVDFIMNGKSYRGIAEIYPTQIYAEYLAAQKKSPNLTGVINPLLKKSSYLGEQENPNSQGINTEDNFQKYPATYVIDESEEPRKPAEIGI